MVSTAMPLQRAGGQCRKIIITPTSRYILAVVPRTTAPM
jgi:hypothetical protein